MILLQFSIYFIIFLLQIVKSQKLLSNNNIDNTKYITANLNNELSGEFFKYGSIYYKNESSKVTDDDACTVQMMKIFESVQKFEPWALEFIDSWGKIPTGILWGHFRDLGNFDECINITKSFSGDEKDIGIINGKYCSAKLPIEELLQSFPLKSYLNNQAGRMGGDGNNAFGQQQGVIIGVCIPQVCKPKMVDDTLKIILEMWNIKINESIIIDGSCIEQKNIEYEAIDWVAIGLFSVIGLIMLLSTVYDLFMQTYEKTSNQLLIAFSIYTNGKKLFHIQDQKSKNVITCLNGIRSLSIIWVIFGHCYITAITRNNINIIQLLQWAQKPYSMLLTYGTVSVDSFLLMSGLLIAWGAMKEMEKTKGKLNIPMMYFHRILRLTPVLGVTILFIVSLARYMGNGPYWDGFLKSTTEICEESWWATLLYVQNYAVSGDKLCIGHSWYLAVDTQLYFLSPLILIPLWIWGKLCFIPIIFLSLFSMACIFTTYVLHDFHTGAWNADVNTQMSLTYFVTHTRYAPWLVGIALGYYMYTKRHGRVNMCMSIIIIGWLISLLTITAVIWGPYYRSQPESNPMPNIESAFYESCSRVSWSIALGWLIFACHHGYGGIINLMLSWKFWQPLSRLSYSIYICHMIIQMIIVSNSKSDYHFSDFEVILKFWGDFAITILISIIMVLAFESPIIGIEKVLFKKTNKLEIPKIESSEYWINNNNDRNPDNILPK